MPSDITRTSDDVRQGYGPPVLQQGRPFLDRDFNALQETLSNSLEADAIDIIGPCGTPDNGFEIMVEPVSPPPGLWVPILKSSPPASTAYDFYIRPGTMYVGGQRAVLPNQLPGQDSPLLYSYFDQPDCRHPVPPATEYPTQEAVSLILREQEVSAVEDPDLLDVALGGPDTTQRLRRMRHIQRCPGKTCSAPADFWSHEGYHFDHKTMRLYPQVALKVSFISSRASHNPCDPVATGGYLGAYNQLLRLQLRSGNSKDATSGSLIWGYDNASFIYRVTLNNAGDLRTLLLAQAPVDAFHQPRTGQVVEVLRIASVLAQDPNALDATRPFTRCVAEAEGLIFTLDKAYQSDGTVGLSQPLPADYASEPFLFLRIWEAQAPANLTSGAEIQLFDSLGQSTGLQVQLSIPPHTGSNPVLPNGAFWLVAVRPGTPQAVYPERFLEAAQPPDGPRLWLCPLAVNDWTGGGGDVSAGSPLATPGILQDCRNKFCNLVGLTQRERASCCTYRVGDGRHTFGDFTSIQEAIKKLPPQGGEVCVLAGRYFEQLDIIDRQDVVIHGCGAETRIASPSLAANAPANNLRPVITILNSQHVELRSFVVETDQGSVGIQIGAPDKEARSPVIDVALRDLIVIAADQSAIAMTGTALKLERSIIASQDLEGNAPAVYAAGTEIHIVENWIGLPTQGRLPKSVEADFQSNESLLAFAMIGRSKAAGGIQIGGPSRDVYILCNEIQRGRGNGITLGSLQIVDTNNKWLRRVIGFYDGGVSRDPCSDGTVVVVTTVPPDSGGQTGHVVVEGDLANIHIEHNRIRNMALAGIGPVGFFNLREVQEVVSVKQLFIINNEIADCPNQAVSALGDAQIAYMGYGAIALPDVADLVIRDNQILNAGAAWSDPVCGIFLLHGEQVEISRNHISDNRVLALSAGKNIPGLRAGINIVLVTPPASQPGKYTSREFSNVSANADSAYQAAAALSLQNNMVNVPLGLAVSIGGLGAFSIQGNHFATGGLAPTGKLALAAGVMICNFGTPVEAPARVTTAAEFLVYLEALNAGATGIEANQAALTAKNITGSLASGPVLFNNNQCSINLSQRSTNDAQLAITAIFISTFDDLGFSNNQSLLQSVRGQVLIDVVTVGWSVRATGNRFQEKRESVTCSNLAGAVWNISSLNTASNRIITFAPNNINTGNWQNA